MTFRESEDRYRSVVEDLTEVIIRIAADGTTLFVNDAYCRFVGKSKEELLGAKWTPIVLAGDIPMIEAELATLSPANPVVIVENRVHSASGELRWFQFVNRGFFDSRGRLLEVQTNAIYWSPECFQILDLASCTGTLESFTDAIHPEDLALVMGAAEKALAEGTDFVAEFRILGPDGAQRWLCDRGRPGCDASGTPLRLAGTVQDITERKLTEESLTRLHDKMSDLSAHLETVREQERLAISRQIHDEIGQTLTALKLDLSWINHRVPPENVELAERLAEMRSGLDYLIAKAQHITAELRPPLLDNLGLAAAIEWQLREFRRLSGIDCRFAAPEGAVPVNSSIATAVMRIFQEALTNTLRHAQATRVRVCLSYCEGSLELEVYDNGSGITSEESGSARAFGVMGMQERARLCQGELEIVGRPGQGTTVCLTIPLQGGEQAAEEQQCIVS